MKKYQNLHSHTTTSDGKLSYSETLKICQENNIEAVAFTDHDSLPNQKEIKNLKKLSSHPVKWISGIEISSDLPKELHRQPIGNFHIVGLFVNPLNQKLQNYCQKKQAARIKRALKMVKNLAQLGFKINQDDLFRESQKSVIGRPHIVAALYKKSENLKLIQKFKNQMEKESRNQKNTRENFKKLLDCKKKEYPYYLFLRHDSFIQGVYVPHLYKANLDQVVSLIRGAGGKAILAHWSSCKKTVKLKLVEKLIKEKRLDGIEVSYNPHGLGSKKEILADMKKMKNLTQKYCTLQSGGADSHTQKDIIKFFKNKKFANQTCGLIQKMIQTAKIDLTWSSLPPRRFCLR